MIPGSIQAYERFEDSLAFSHTPLVLFWNTLVKAIGDCETGCLNHFTLLTHFKDVGEHWRALSDYESVITKIVMCSFLKQTDFENQDDIEFDYLATYGFLMCPGTCQEKVEILFHIVNSGGVSESTLVERQDQYFPTIWRKMLKFCTVYLFEFAKHFAKIENVFEPFMQTLYNVIEDFSDNSLEKEFQQQVFGEATELPYKVWCSRVVDRCSWICDPRLVR